MGSIRTYPQTSVVTTGSYVESFINWCPCGRAQQPRLPHMVINVSFRPVESRKKPSPGSFTNLSRRFSRVEPLRSLPGGPGSPRNSYTENAGSSSDDGVQRGEEPESTSAESSSESQREPPSVPVEKQKPDPKTAAQSALERAAAYKKQKKLGSSSTTQSGQSLALPKRPETDLPDIEIVRGQNIQSRLQPTNSLGSSPSESSTFTPQGSSPIANVDSTREDGTRSQDGDNVDVRRFIEEKMATERLPDVEDGTAPTAVSSKEKLEPVSLTAFERAKAYKQQQEEMIAALRGKSLDESSVSSSKEGSPDQSAGAANEKVMEIEIVTRDGVIKRKIMNPEEQTRAFSNIKDVKRKGVSGIDFAGLGFADKKKSGRPAGSSEGFVAPPTGALPEVEILTRDAGSPQTEIAEQPGQDSEQLYKPRVSTWGLFPRPADISKAYGGGRTIRPGESLETEEERKVREARTQKVLADYRRKMGLDVDPMIKAESEQVFKQGDRLMDNGRLREALMLYESAMNKMPPQSELHGRAALQAAVCLDSLRRCLYQARMSTMQIDEARKVYERLLAHPNGAVSKQARRFLFGFTAMEKLKVDGGYKWDTSPYRKYFDSFAGGYNTTYKAEDGEETNENLLPYALLILCPILLVFALAPQDRVKQCSFR